MIWSTADQDKRNPDPEDETSVWNTTDITLLVLVKGGGITVPQNLANCTVDGSIKPSRN